MTTPPADVLTGAEQLALPPGCQCSYALSHRDGRWHLITRERCPIHGVGDFPFPLAPPRPQPVMVTRPCGCTSMVVDDDTLPVQVSWCVAHDPGYEPPGA